MLLEIKNQSTSTVAPITSAHFDEWVKKSGIHEAIARLNLKSIDNPVEIARLLNWQKYFGTDGWYVLSCDPHTGKIGSSGQFKPNEPIVFPNQEKEQKYFSFPKDGESSAIFLLLALSNWIKISERVGVPIANEDIDESRDDLGFWQWVLNHPEIPILITEGAKKAGCLLSHGWVAIALTGVWNGQKKKKLHPSLVPFIVPGRPVDLAFDADVVVKQSVMDALRVLGHLIHRALGIVRIVTWDLKLGKGCDDFIVAEGVEEFEAVMENATPYSEWLKKLERQFQQPESITNTSGKARTQKIPPADMIGQEIIEDYRDQLLWSDQHKSWMYYGLEHFGVWTQVSDLYVESVIDKILESQNIVGYGSASYVTNIATKMKRSLLEREWNERSASEILPFTDGVRNLATGKLEKHSPGNRLTWCLPRPYNCVATSWATINSWLDSATGGNSAHKEILLCFAAAALRGRCDLQKFMHLIGFGGTGKSTYTRLLEAVIGEQNCWNGSLKDLEDKHEVARLVGKRLVILPDQDKVTSSLSNFKRLTGQDTLFGRRLYKDGINFRFPGLAIVTSNLPIFHADGGSWLTRRILMLAFNYKPASDQLRDLEVEFEPELSAFTNYLLSIPNDEITRVLRRIASDGVSPTLWSAKIRTDSIAAWVNEWVMTDPTAITQIGCDRNEWVDNDYNALISTLFGSYSHYCRISGLQAKGKNNFSADLIELCEQTLGWNVAYDRDSRGRRVIKGLRLRSDGDTAPTWEDFLKPDNPCDHPPDNPSDNLKALLGQSSDNSDKLSNSESGESTRGLESNQIIDHPTPQVFTPPVTTKAETTAVLPLEGAFSVVGAAASQVVSQVDSEPDALAAPQAAARCEGSHAMSENQPITSTSPATPLEVGARVVWSNASAHVAAWNPFTITDINGDTAMLDIYAHPVPLNELRRVE